MVLADIVNTNVPRRGVVTLAGSGQHAPAHAAADSLVQPVDRGDELRLRDFAEVGDVVDQVLRPGHGVLQVFQVLVDQPVAAEQLLDLAGALSQLGADEGRPATLGQPLVIDPVLTYSSYLGGSMDEVAYGVLYLASDAMRVLASRVLPSAAFCFTSVSG